MTGNLTTHRCCFFPRTTGSCVSVSITENWIPWSSNIVIHYRKWMLESINSVMYNTLPPILVFKLLEDEDPQERQTTMAFSFPSWIFQCVQMPFGLTNAPAFFQRALDFIFTKYTWKTCLFYLDDLTICSNNVEDHIKQVDEVLTTLADAGVTLKINKCHLFQQQLGCLGQMVKSWCLEIEKKNFASFRNEWKTENKKLRSLLELCPV